MTFRFIFTRETGRRVTPSGVRCHLPPPRSDVPDHDAIRTDYYVIIHDETCGPFTREQLRAMWKQGQVDGRTLFARFGMTSWLPLVLLLPECDRAEYAAGESANGG
ncbi:MAG: DUF4339 domain-containing protein [Verrucomicrobia bacterium]|nr:DUF4339 domain-containing protein [Verrucomicrobiota bacterium]